MHVIGICYHCSVITAKRRFYLYERSLLFLSFYTHVTSILGSWYMSQSFIILKFYESHGVRSLPSCSFYSSFKHYDVHSLFV